VLNARSWTRDNWHSNKPDNELWRVTCLREDDPPLATSQQIMSSRDTSARPSTPSKLDKAIQATFESLKFNFQAGFDDNRIMSLLSTAYSIVYVVISNEGGPNLKKRLKGWGEFLTYVKSGSKEERKLIDLLRNMTNEQVSWRELFENGTFLSSLRCRAHWSSCSISRGVSQSRARENDQTSR
jgi:hypothetical protein